MKIFLNDWLNLDDAVDVYNDNSGKSKRRTVAFYLNKFKRQKWLEEKEEPVEYIKKSKKDKFFRLITSTKKYQLNYNFYFESKGKKISKEMKEFILQFLNHDYIRDYIAGGNQNFEEMIDQLLMYLHLLSNYSVILPNFEKKLKSKYKITLKKPRKGYSWKVALKDNAELIDKKMYNYRSDNKAAWALIWLYAVNIRNMKKQRKELLQLVAQFEDINEVVNLLI